MLGLSSEDKYDSHTAIRHLSEIDKSGYSVDLILPIALRKHKAFTPWLAEGKTVAKANPVSSTQDKKVIMSFVRAPPSHVHHGGPHTHKASFDVRIGGAMVRTLLDSGADASVISKKFLDRLGIPYQSNKISGTVGGIGGGSVKTYGTAQIAVKLGKYHPVHQFYIIPDSESGYDCILGDDFLHPY